MSDDDIRRLEIRARQLVEPNQVKDLIQEAYCRVLGDRRWRANMKTVPFFYGVMRSVADQWREKGVIRTLPLDTVPLPSPGAHYPLADHVTPERNVMAAEDIRNLEAIFANDEHVCWLLLGLAEGNTAIEIQQQSGMTAQEFDAARKRLARHRARSRGDK